MISKYLTGKHGERRDLALILDFMMEWLKKKSKISYTIIRLLD